MVNFGYVWDWWLRRLALGYGRKPDGTAVDKGVERKANLLNWAGVYVLSMGLVAGVATTADVITSTYPEYLAVASVFTLPIFVLVYVLVVRASRESRRWYPFDEEKDIRLKTDRLTSALTEAAQLSVELNDLLRDRRAVLDDLREEIKRWERQAKISKEDAATLTDALDRSVERGVRHLDRMSFFWGMLATAVAVGAAFLPDLLKHAG